MSIKITIKNPRHVDGAIESLERALRSDRRREVPESIRGYMLAVPCKRMLRAIYGGGNGHVAWCLVVEAVGSRWRGAWWRLRSRLGLLGDDEIFDEIVRDEK